MNTGAGRAAYANANFTKPEAVAKVGKYVRLGADLGQLVEGARGNIVDFHETDDGRFQVVVRWNPWNGSEPLYDVFGKSKYYQLITED
jgi:hypothetical protein